MGCLLRICYGNGQPFERKNKELMFVVLPAFDHVKSSCDCEFGENNDLDENILKRNFHKYLLSILKGTFRE